MTDSDDDFMALIDTTRPLKGRGERVKTERTRPLEIRLRQTADDRIAHAATKAGKVSVQGKDIDAATAKRLKQGKIRPESRLDLHGLTLDRAHAALRRFIVAAATDNQRCVLVITGKGPIDTGGAIKQALPHWLDEAPLHTIVLKAEPAKPADGGTGAYYLYLRRARRVD